METEQVLQERAHRQQPDLRRLIEMLERQRDTKLVEELKAKELAAHVNHFQVA
jgi:hypothetical protein